MTGSSPTCQHALQAQHEQQAQHAQQAKHAQQAHHQQQHVKASRLYGDWEQHAGGPAADSHWKMPGHQQQNTMQRDSKLRLAQQRANELHHRQPEKKALDDCQPRREGFHDGLSQMDDDYNDWRQKGHLPVTHWLRSQADDTGKCVPGLHGDALGDMARLNGDALGSMPANVQQVTGSATAPLFCLAFSNMTCSCRAKLRCLNAIFRDLPQYAFVPCTLTSHSPPACRLVLYGLYIYTSAEEHSWHCCQYNDDRRQISWVLDS